MEMLVEYEYLAAQEDELTLRPGDIIKNVHRIEEEGWMEGELNGKKGLFPDNFVKEVKKDSKETKEEVKEETQPVSRRVSGNVASLVQRISTYGIPAGGFTPGTQPHLAKKKSKKRQCKALFEYVPQNEDELELKLGDIIEITEEVEEGWWSGILNGKSGLFPSNFVTEIEESEDTDADSSNTEPDGASISREGQGSQASNSSSEAKAQAKKVKGVGFGDIFNQGSVKLKPAPLPSSTKPQQANATDSAKQDGDSKTKDGESKAKEFCKATFTYDATNQDELDIKEGDIIEILSKDTGEPGWWRGEINGRTGVFPDNFVLMVSDVEREKPKKPPPPVKVTGDKVAPDPKPVKPAAPVVPPKKPIPLPGKGRPGGGPPKRPEKPLVPTPSTTAAKHNGEVPSSRPKPDPELALHLKPKPPVAGDGPERTTDTADLMLFDEVSSASEKLSHPTVNRPKMPGRRLPAQFGGNHSPTKETPDSAPRDDTEDSTPAFAAKPLDFVKPPMSTTTPSSASTAAPVPCSNSKATAPSSPHGLPHTATSSSCEPRAKEMEELRSQMKEVLMTVELLKTQQMRELAELRSDLENERSKRLALQIEIDKLKKLIHSS